MQEVGVFLKLNNSKLNAFDDRILFSELAAKMLL